MKMAWWSGLKRKSRTTLSVLKIPPKFSTMPSGEAELVSEQLLKIVKNCLVLLQKQTTPYHEKEQEQMLSSGNWDN